MHPENANFCGEINDKYCHVKAQEDLAELILQGTPGVTERWLGRMGRKGIPIPNDQ